MLNEQEKKIIIESLKPFDPSFIGLFGSCARSEESPESDVDILYDFKARYTFFDLIDLETSLKSKLKRDVDLVSLRYIKPYFKKYIADDLIYLVNEKNEQIIS